MSQSQDYTGITERKWSDETTIQIEEGETALVARADGSLHLHIPGGLNERATRQQQLIMLASLLLSGTPMAEDLFQRAINLREQSLDLVSVDESLPN